MELLGKTLHAIEIEGRARLRIGAVAQALGKRKRQGQRPREVAGQNLSGSGEIMRDRGVVLRYPFECRDRKLAAQRRRYVAGLRGSAVLRVLRRMRQDRDVLEVLCRRTQQCDASDID